jgi:hypothetical protein
VANNGTRASRGWVISAAFIGQVGIFLGIGALLTGATTTQAAMPVADAPVPVAVAAPAVTAPVPAIFAPVPLGNVFRYTFSMYGQASGGAVSDVYPDRRAALPAYTVKPGHQAGIRLSVTIPGDLKLTDLTLTFAEVVPEYEHPADQALYQGTGQQPLAPGRHTYVVSWPGSGSRLQPGTRWLVYLSASSNAVADGSPIATVTVAGTLGTQLP